MQAKLDGFARAYSPAPGMVIRMLPFLPVFWNDLNKTMRDYIKDRGQEWTGAHDIFIMTAPLITSMTTGNEELPVELAVLAFWQTQRIGAITEDWHLFEQMCPYASLEVLWSAYEATRKEADVPRAPEVLQTPAPVPVNDDGITENPTTAGGG